MPGPMMSYPLPNYRKLHPKYVDLLQRKIDSVEGDGDQDVKFKVFLSVIHSGFYDCDPNNVGNENDKVCIKHISDRTTCDVYRFASDKIAPRTLVVKLYKDCSQVRAFDSFKSDFLRNQFFRNLLKNSSTPKEVRETIYVNEHDAVYKCEKNEEIIKVYSTVGVFRGETIYRLCKHFTEDWDAEDLDKNLKSMIASYNSLCSAITWLHSRFVYHCNIDPCNILFDLDNMRFWLVDFDNAYCGDFYETMLDKNKLSSSPKAEEDVRMQVDLKKPLIKSVYQTTEVFQQALELRRRISVYKNGKFVLKQGEMVSPLNMSNGDKYPFYYVMMHFFCKVCSHFKSWSRFGVHIMTIIVNLPQFDNKCIESVFVNLQRSKRHWYFCLKELISKKNIWDSLVDPAIKGYTDEKLVQFQEFLNTNLANYDPEEGDSEGTQDFIFDCSNHYDLNLTEGYFVNGRKRKAPAS